MQRGQIYFQFLTLAAAFICVPLLSFGGGQDTSLIVDKSKKEYLEMRGVVKISKAFEKGEEIQLENAEIFIYSDTTIQFLLKVVTEKKGKCEFRLPLDRKLYILVTKEGFVSKKIEVNTKVPKEKKAAFIFPFSLDIFEKIDGLDVSILNKPIAKVNYSINKDQFDYDYAYTNKVNSDLKLLYRDYYALKRLEKELNPLKTENPVPAEKRKNPRRRD